MSALQCFSVRNGVAASYASAGGACMQLKHAGAKCMATPSHKYFTKAPKGEGRVKSEFYGSLMPGFQLEANHESSRKHGCTQLPAYRTATLCSAAKPAQLYFTPTSCGAASYISAYKAGILGKLVEANLVDIRAHKVLSGPKKGEDYYAINNKGNVPGLVLDGNILLNEGSAVLQWIADQNPQAHLAPPNGTPARYVLQSKLNYLASEVHASCGPLFNPALPDEVRAFTLAKLKTKLDFLIKWELTPGKKYLTGDNFTVADAYLYIILSWMPNLKVDLAPYPQLQAYYDNIASLDFVKTSHAEMQEIVKSA